MQHAWMRSLGSDHLSATYLPSIYYLSTIYLPSIFHLSTIHLPSIYHPCSLYLPCRRFPTDRCTLTGNGAVPVSFYVFQCISSHGTPRAVVSINSLTVFLVPLPPQGYKPRAHAYLFRVLALEYILIFRVVPC